MNWPRGTVRCHLWDTIGAPPGAGRPVDGQPAAILRLRWSLASDSKLSATVMDCCRTWKSQDHRPVTGYAVGSVLKRYSASAWLWSRAPRGLSSCQEGKVMDDSTELSSGNNPRIENREIRMERPRRLFDNLPRSLVWP